MWVRGCPVGVVGFVVVVCGPNLPILQRNDVPVDLYSLHLRRCDISGVGDAGRAREAAESDRDIGEVVVICGGIYAADHPSDLKVQLGANLTSYDNLRVINRLVVRQVRRALNQHIDAARDVGAGLRHIDHEAVVDLLRSREVVVVAVRLERGLGLGRPGREHALRKGQNSREPTINLFVGGIAVPTGQFKAMQAEP